MNVEFKAKHRALLEDALKSLGWDFQFVGDVLHVTRFDMRIDLAKEEARIEEQMQGRLNELKRAYSDAALSKVAKMNLWSRKVKSGTKGVLRKF